MIVDLKKKKKKKSNKKKQFDWLLFWALTVDWNEARMRKMNIQ